MFPLGDYDRLVHEIKRREQPEIPVSFGLLIADFSQTRSREYILNYIDRFDYKSARYINFYLPGYLEKSFSESDQAIRIKDESYYFSHDIYRRFLDKLETDFDIDYLYNPTLILMEYHRGKFNKSKKIVIHLDDNGADVRKAGRLFEEIFDVAKRHVNIEDFSKELALGECKDGLFDTIVSVIGNKYLTEIHKGLGRARKYKLS